MPYTTDKDIALIPEASDQTISGMIHLIDTNILIDFECAGILEYLFRLNIEWVVPDLLVEELKDPDLATLQRLGLRVVELPGEAVEEVARLSEVYPRLSVGDCSLLVPASYQKTILVTRDRQLKQAAEERGVSVKDTCWVLCQLIARRVLLPQDVEYALLQMQDNGRRLPLDEYNKRLQQWESDSSYPLSPEPQAKGLF